MIRYVKGVFIILLFGVLELKAQGTGECKDFLDKHEYKKVYTINYDNPCEKFDAYLVIENIKNLYEVSICTKQFTVNMLQKTKGKKIPQVIHNFRFEELPEEKFKISNYKKPRIANLASNFLVATSYNKYINFNPFGSDQLSFEDRNKQPSEWLTTAECSIRFERIAGGIKINTKNKNIKFENGNSVVTYNKVTTDYKSSDSDVK